MSHERKSSIICPICGNIALKSNHISDVIYHCNECGFISTDKRCVDISYKDDLSAPLSNLYPNSFNMLCEYNGLTLGRAFVSYPSMETFLQSLKIKDPHIQYNFVKSYSGIDAKKMSGVLDKWKDDHTLYFDEKSYDRYSPEYQTLITRAFDALYNTNDIFRKLVLPRFKGCYIIHSLGLDDPSETVLTEAEFRYQINRLLSKLAV